MALYPFKDFITTMADGIQKALRISGYDEHDDMLKVKSMQAKWRAGFTGTELSDKRWETVQVGTNQTINVVNGILEISTGTTANAETIIRSKQEFTIPMRAMMNVALTQRIANQEFFVELVSVDEGEPNSHSMAGWLFDGTSVTQAKYQVNGGDQPTLTSIASTVTTTAGVGGIYEIEPTSDEVWFFGRTLDTTTGRTNNFVRHSQIPSADLKYKLQIRVKNGTTAPASNTIFKSQFANVSDYAELTAEITAGRGGAVAGQSIAVTPTSLPTLGTLSTLTTGNVRTMGLWYLDSVANLGASGVFTGVNRTVGSATLMNWSVIRVRVYSLQAGTLYIDQSRTTTEADFRCPNGHSFPVSAGQCIQVEVPLMSFYARVRYVNGGTAQTAFELTSCLVGTT